MFCQSRQLRNVILHPLRRNSLIKHQCRSNMSYNKKFSGVCMKHCLQGTIIAHRNIPVLTRSRCHLLIVGPSSFSSAYSSIHSNSLICHSVLTNRKNRRATGKLYTIQTIFKNGLCRSFSNSDDKINYVHQLLDILKRSESLGEPRVSPRDINKHLKDLRMNRISKDGGYKEDNLLTVEKRVLTLMSKWKTDEAVDLLIESLERGYIPAGNVVLNLMQQLAHLGEVDSILDINKFLHGKHVTTETNFYDLLSSAYCNSGRVEEAAAMLRIIYHRTRNFKDADLFFTLVTIMIIQNFEHRLYLIEDFVHDLLEADPPIKDGKASLWKCFMLTQKFDQADALIIEDENLKKLVPAQVSSIIQLPSSVIYNKEIVLPKLIDSPYIRQALKAAVFHHWIQHKCDENKWQDALDCLMDAMKNNEEVVRLPVITLFLSSFFTQLSDAQVTQLEKWADSLDVTDTTDDRTDDQKDSGS